jgi:glycosyltransferase involved in cell wall biosynthesis
MPNNRHRNIKSKVTHTKAFKTSDANDHFRRLTDNYSISDGIGVGILSYNRVISLIRLINSIVRNTDLNKTTIFISDDASNDPKTSQYINTLRNNTRLNMVVLNNDTNLGVAGNSNRLLKCLSRFKYQILLNDDVEVLQKGWESFYFEAMRDTGFNHFIRQQVGVYGGKNGKKIKVGPRDLLRVDSKPQGAVLAFTNEMAVKCGDFDESYGKYGMEHVDWSMKAFELKLQDKGFFDVEGSDRFFKVYSEASSVPDKGGKLASARSLFESRTPCKVFHANAALPEISYVIPYRELARNDSLRTVVNNIRAQKFPVIRIILSEHDTNSKINYGDLHPCNTHIASETSALPFNKSKAFNLGVSKSNTDKIILHDADMLIPDGYTVSVSNALDKYEACHLGKSVTYACPNSTDLINKSRAVNRKDLNMDRLVCYYEGGSLACLKQTYWSVGGFNEDFWGYGYEDNDFYHRLKQSSNFLEDRKTNLLHLAHPRSPDFSETYKANSEVYDEVCKMSMSKRIISQKQQISRYI